MQEIFMRRRDRLRDKIRQEGLNGYLVLHPPNRYYLSGFELHDPQCNESAGCLLIGRDGTDYLCTDPRYQQEGQQLWDEEYLFVYKENRIAQLADFISKQGFSVLGFETRIMSYEMYAHLNEHIELKPYKGIVEDLRVLKDDFEIECLQSSCSLNHEVFTYCTESFDPNLTEDNLAWGIEKYFRENGASELAFTPIVAFGTHSALPHYLPGQSVLGSESPVLIDIGGRFMDYCSDQTRTFWFGEKLPDYFSRTREMVQEAQKLAIDSIRPGVKINDIFNLTKEYFGRYGVDEHFIHSLGHGIGLETHEYPGLGPRNKDVFRQGMVVTIEPGLYFPKWGGVRWEHMVVITDDGVQVL